MRANTLLTKRLRLPLECLEEAGSLESQELLRQERLRVKTELGTLATILPLELRDTEKELRDRFLEAEGEAGDLIFLQRIHRAEFLLKYQAIYGPLRKWSAFLRIVKVPRQTAYDLTASLEAPTAPEPSETDDDLECPSEIECTESVHLESYLGSLEDTVDKIVSFIRKTTKGMTYQMRDDTLARAWDVLHA